MLHLRRVNCQLKKIKSIKKIEADKFYQVGRGRQ